MKNYANEQSVLILIALLKSHGIKKVIASPGATNISVVASLQSDPWFEMYSCFDERSAAYMACGLAAESGEPVMLTCTGATSSRNYLPALTEAYYRNLPVLVVTSSQSNGRIGHMSPQLTNRSTAPADTLRLSLQLPIVKDDNDVWECETKINQAILELHRGNGGPVHLNLQTIYARDYSVVELPKVRKISRFTQNDILPKLDGRVAIFAGAHKEMSQELTQAIDDFCAANDAVVFCDHTSGYHGKYRVFWNLAAVQKVSRKESRPDIMIHIGEISGAYMNVRGNKTWRVSADGELKDFFKNLENVFEMPELFFFKHYAERGEKSGTDSYLKSCLSALNSLRERLPDLPFSNLWIAKESHKCVPANSVIHFGILNSLRSWNFFDVDSSVAGESNTGGFGIDGCSSTIIGASLADSKKLHFLVSGDLAFFYDLNAICNRHIGNNVRILLINNGKGIEFRNFNHIAAQFGEETDKYIAAGAHCGNQSRNLVKNFAQALGFEYLSAENKDEFSAARERFWNPEILEKPMIFEVFTETEKESDALKTIMSLEEDSTTKAKEIARGILGDSGVKLAKKLLGK